MTRRSDRRSGGGLAPERIVQAAVEAYLGGAQPARDERDERERSHRGSGVSALALGVAIGVGARVAYRRARAVDLAQVARAVERRMVN